MNIQLPRLRSELVPLLIASFLAPIMGGQVPTEPVPLLGNPLGELFGGTSLVYLTWSLFAIVILGGLAMLLVRKRVIVIPRLDLCLSLAGVIGFTGIASLWTSFPSAAIPWMGYWILLAGSFILAVATCGREDGIVASLLAAVLGGTFTAIRGILEFISVMRVEPTHRIFAGWLNPNATAGLLIIILPLAAALLLSGHRWPRILTFACIPFITCALVLTQSKGGYLCAIVALIFFIGYAFAAGQGKKLLTLALALALGVGLTFGLIRVSRNAAEGGDALARVANASTSADQSVSFRKDLWQGAVALVKEQPLGWGAGSYRYVSAKPGLTEQTVLTHEVYLQVAVDGGVLALISLVIFAFQWFRQIFPGDRTTPIPQRIMKAGVVAAILATGINFTIESNLYYSGIGILTFILLGLGIQLAPDASSPEVLPGNMRYPLALLGCLGTMLILVIQGTGQLSKARFLTDISGSDQAKALDDLSDMVRAYPNDPEIAYLSGLYAKSGSERLAAFRRASEALPTTRYLRAYAKSAADASQFPNAQAALKKALYYDPNNLRTKFELMNLDVQMGDEVGAIEAATSLVEVEKTAYFLVRAIPELVPTETLEARIFLASRAKTAKDKADLLQKAVDGFVKYAQITVPKVKMMSEGGGGNFAGEDTARMKEKMAIAAQAATELARIYFSVGKTDLGKIAKRDQLLFAGS